MEPNWSVNNLEFDIRVRMKFDLDLRIWTDLNLIEITLVYAELIAYKSDRVDMPNKKVQVYILYEFGIYEPNWQAVWRLIFFWVQEGPERRVGVWDIDQYKGGAGEFFSKVKALENFQDFWKFS